MSLYTETILPPRETKGLSRWVVALIVVIAIHLAVGAWIVMRRTVEKPAGSQGQAVMIDLAPIATAPAQAAPPKPQAAPPKVEPPPPPPEPPMQSVPEAPAVMTAPPPVTPPIPKILQTEESPVTLPPPPPPKPAPDKVKEQKQIDLQKRLEQKRVEQERRHKEQVELRKKRAEKQKERAERAKAAANARAKQAAQRAAAPRPGASSQSIAAWRSEVYARVNSVKPAFSGENGSVMLVFTVEANGRVGSAHIAHSSGSATLDRAALAMARRIGRLPPPPVGRVTVRAPVRFGG